MDVATIDVIKQGGSRPTERFEPKKLHDSVLAACLSVRSPHGEAETVTRSVCALVHDWAKGRNAVTSADLRRTASSHLGAMHPEAAYLYKHHRLVL